MKSGAMPGVPGLFTKEQAAGWKRVVEGVHSKGGYIYAQLWHSGRVAIPQITGLPAISASATPFVSDDLYSYAPPGTTKKVRYKDYPPVELSEEGIKRVINEYVEEAKVAMEVGFDGIEVHGGNGYREFRIGDKGGHA